MAVISIHDMLEAGAHFGHQTERWHPKMKPYIFEARNGIHIINLKLTVNLFDKAYEAVRDAAANGDGVLFVGTKKQSHDIIREEAEKCGQFYVISRWLGGTLTNFRTIRNSIERFNELQKMAEEGVYNVRTKKEALKLDKLRLRMAKNFNGISKMTKLPGIIFIIDPVKDRNAIEEAGRLGIPVVALCDTNSNPETVDYPIPANDDAVRSIRLFVSKLAEAAIEGRAIYESGMKETAAAAADSKAASSVKVKKAKLGKRDDRRRMSEGYAEPVKESPAAAEDAPAKGYDEMAETLDKKRYRKQ